MRNAKVILCRLPNLRMLQKAIGEADSPTQAHTLPMAEETVTNLQEPASDSPSMVLMVAAQHEACQRSCWLLLTWLRARRKAWNGSGALS